MITKTVAELFSNLFPEKTNKALNFLFLDMTVHLPNG